MGKSADFSYIRDSERAGSALPAGGTTTVPANVSNDTQDFREQMRKALDEAKRNPVIVSVVNWLVSQIVIAFMELEQSPEDDETTIYQQHALLYLLQNPSPFMSGKELLSVSGWDMLTEGQAFWHKDRLRNGQIEGLTFLPAKSVTPVGSREELIAKYVYKPAANARSEDYLPEDIVHIRIAPDPDDPKNGLSPLKSLPAALLIEDLSSTYMLTFMNPGRHGRRVPDASRQREHPRRSAGRCHCERNQGLRAKGVLRQQTRHNGRPDDGYGFYPHRDRPQVRRHRGVP